MSTRNIYVKNTPLSEARQKWFAALDECGFFKKGFPKQSL